MAVELPNKALSTHISMMGNPRGIQFASVHTQLQDSLQERYSKNDTDLIIHLLKQHNDMVTVKWHSIQQFISQSRRIR